MAKSPYQFTIGIEEEYQIVDPETRELSSSVEILLKDGQDRLGNQITTEMMQCQVEVGTRVCTSIQEAREQITTVRREVNDIARKNGVAIVAAGTHPISKWTDQDMTSRARYRGLEMENRLLARQLLICGMHMHVGIEDQELRIDLMNQISYFLPHLLCLSTSSPFWGGMDTGLK
ncbi:MAG: hypothetical protein LC662_09280, partial [Rhodothermaceae bacterium]|nr:hypothetical protein [Rhodothermaceae bacterium]